MDFIHTGICLAGQRFDASGGDIFAKKKHDQIRAVMSMVRVAPVAMVQMVERR